MILLDTHIISEMMKVSPFSSVVNWIDKTIYFNCNHCRNTLRFDGFAR